jgi:hypothetical protein
VRYRIALIVLLVSLGGCGPELSKSDLGTVSYEEPKIPGADRPYEMPQLGPPVDAHQDRAGQPLP